MGHTRPSHRRAIAIALASLIVTAAAPDSPATADTLNPTPASAQGLPSAQINGVVWTQAASNGVDYLGGQFTRSRPAGSPEGSDETARRNLLAMDVSTGAAVPGFDATTNGTVRAIAVSEDGSRIYVAGDFTAVDGQPRNRVAALTPDGQLVAGFDPDVNGLVYALAVRGSTIYLGGTFTQVGGQARGRAAAIDTSGGVLGWAPAVADQAVRAIAVSPDGGTVLLGGNFTAVNGRKMNGLGAVSAASGSYISWPASSLSQNGGPNTAITSLSSRNGMVYATGYAYRSVGNLEGAISMRWSDGTATWVDNCHGDTYSSVPFDDALYTAGHAHDCSSIGGFPNTVDPIIYHRAIAFSQAAGSNVVQGSGDFNPLYGKPAPNILDWYPTLKEGTFTGQFQAAWSVIASGPYLVYAGEFLSVNGVPQQGIVRFQGVDDGSGAGTVPPATGPTTPPTTPPTPAPAGAKPGRVSTPDAIALGPTAVAAKWSAPKGASSARITGYVVKAYLGSKVVRTVSVGSSKRLATVSGLKRSTRYSIRVLAKNSHGSGPASAGDAVRTKAEGKNVSATKKPSKVSEPTAGTGKGRVRVRWKAASATGALAVTHYQVRVVLHGRTVTTSTVDDRLRSELVTGLKRRTGYTVSVRAGSWAGWGSWSTGRSARTE